MSGSLVLIGFLVVSGLFVFLLDRWIRGRPEKDETGGSNDFSGGNDGGFGGD